MTVERGFIYEVMANEPTTQTYRIDVPDGVHTSRDAGEELREALVQGFWVDRPQQLEIAFQDVKALTISFVDAFIGRFLTELVATGDNPVQVTLTGLTEETAPEVDVVLERRGLVAAALVDGAPTLLGDHGHLRETFLAATELGRFTPNDLAAALSLKSPNVNNRLRRLVENGALTRRRSDPAAGGKEFSYELPVGLLRDV